MITDEWDADALDQFIRESSKCLLKAEMITQPNSLNNQQNVPYLTVDLLNSKNNRDEDNCCSIYWFISYTIILSHTSLHSTTTYQSKVDSIHIKPSIRFEITKDG